MQDYSDIKNCSRIALEVTMATPNDVTRAEDILAYDDIIARPVVRYVMAVIYITTIVIATMGNFLVILLIYRKKSLRRNPAVLYILNLAVCDFISSLVWRPMSLAEMLLPFADNASIPVTKMNISYCRVTTFLGAIFAAVGFHTVVAISVERLLLICFPLQAKTWCTCSRTKKIVLLIWLIAIIAIIPAPIITTELVQVKVSGYTMSACAIFGLSSSPGGVAYFLFIFVFYFAMPLLTLTVAYGVIFRVLNKRAQVLDEHSDAVAIRSMRSRRNLAKMMLFVGIIFAIAYGPSFLFMMVLSTGVDEIDRNGFFISILCEWLPSISSLLNPFIYTLNSRTFRNGFQSFITFRRKARNDYWRAINSRQDSLFITFPQPLMENQNLHTNGNIYCKRHDVTL